MTAVKAHNFYKHYALAAKKPNKDRSLAPLVLIENNLRIISKNSIRALSFNRGGIISQRDEKVKQSVERVNANLFIFARFTKKFLACHPLPEREARETQKLLTKAFNTLCAYEKINQVNLGETPRNLILASEEVLARKELSVDEESNGDKKKIKESMKKLQDKVNKPRKNLGRLEKRQSFFVGSSIFSIFSALFLAQFIPLFSPLIFVAGAFGAIGTLLLLCTVYVSSKVSSLRRKVFPDLRELHTLDKDLKKLSKT